MAATKTVCPLTREDFDAKAKPVPMTLQGKAVDLETKQFSTGSMGWYFNGKMTLEIDGVRVTCQVGCNVTIVGSKDLPPKGE